MINILRQHTEDRDLKLHCLACLERTNSFAYTVGRIRFVGRHSVPLLTAVKQRETLRALEAQARSEIARLGGNDHLVGEVGTMGEERKAYAPPGFSRPGVH